MFYTSVSWEQNASHTCPTISHRRWGSVLLTCSEKGPRKTARLQQGAQDTVFPRKSAPSDFLSLTPHFRSMILGHRGPLLAPGSERDSCSGSQPSQMARQPPRGQGNILTQITPLLSCRSRLDGSFLEQSSGVASLNVKWSEYQFCLVPRLKLPGDAVTSRAHRSRREAALVGIPMGRRARGGCGTGTRARAFRDPHASRNGPVKPKVIPPEIRQMAQILPQL